MNLSINDGLNFRACSKTCLYKEHYLLYVGRVEYIKSFADFLRVVKRKQGEIRQYVEKRDRSNCATTNF